jgi:hypothetical protein
VTEKRILLSPRVKPGEVLTPATAEMVKQFYVCDEISRIMPGMEDYVSVNSEGKKSCFTIEKLETRLCRLQIPALIRKTDFDVLMIYYLCSML